MRSAVALALLAAICLCASAAWGVVVSDNPDLHMVQPDSPYDMVGYLSNQTSAVMIDSWHALTAKHCVAGGIDGMTMTLDLPGGRQTFSVAKAMLSPTADLAVIQLDRSTGLTGYPLYTGSDEKGKIAILTGYGVSGVGRPEAGFPRGTLRVGYNRIDAAGDGTLTFDLDAPTSAGYYGSLGRSYEALPAPGDSGGATFISLDGELYLAGVHSYITDINGSGVYPDWGDQAGDVRVSDNAAWIDAHRLPEPATLSMMVMGGLVLLRRKKKRTPY